MCSSSITLAALARRASLSVVTFGGETRGEGGGGGESGHGTRDCCAMAMLTPSRFQPITSPNEEIQIRGGKRRLFLLQATGTHADDDHYKSTHLSTQPPTHHVTDCNQRVCPPVCATCLCSWIRKSA